MAKSMESSRSAFQCPVDMIIGCQDCQNKRRNVYGSEYVHVEELDIEQMDVAGLCVVCGNIVLTTLLHRLSQKSLHVQSYRVLKQLTALAVLDSRDTFPVSRGGSSKRAVCDCLHHVFCCARGECGESMRLRRAAVELICVLALDGPSTIAMSRSRVTETLRTILDKCDPSSKPAQLLVLSVLKCIELLLSHPSHKADVLALTPSVARIVELLLPPAGVAWPESEAVPLVRRLLFSIGV